MLRVLATALLLLFLVAGTGCIGLTPAPVQGLIYSNVEYPMAELDAYNEASGMKKGEATASSILTLIATGDASIEAAAKNAGITKIQHVDYRSTNILGIFATFTTIVYGE